MDMVMAVEVCDTEIRRRARRYRLFDAAMDDEDLVQEVYLSAWARMACGGPPLAFDDGGAAVRYFGAAMSNEAIDIRRRHAVRERIGLATVPLDEGRSRPSGGWLGDVPGQAIDNIMLADYLALAAHDPRLSPGLLCALGWEYDEQAMLTGVPAQTLKSRAFQTRKRLYSRYFVGEYRVAHWARSRDLVAEAMAL